MKLALLPLFLLMAGLAAGSSAVAGAQAVAPARQAPPPAPAPGSPGIYRAGPQLLAALKAAMARTQELAASNVATTDQYQVNVINRRKPGNPLAHQGNTELHYIIEGAGTLVTGGRIVTAAGDNGPAATVEGGETRQVGPGDVVIVPAGSAHWYKAVDGSITYLEVRFVAPK
jgi:mannose-6-phosphate isomerase-like protein (cupin superfamily)